jgi:VIT1/CCC1 family predicted Fe2+/Mn2+ transporter
MWQQWVNAILGVWLIVLAFLGFTGATLMWSLAITGLVVAILGVWGALGDQSSTSRRAAYQ